MWFVFVSVTHAPDFMSACGRSWKASAADQVWRRKRSSLQPTELHPGPKHMVMMRIIYFLLKTAVQGRWKVTAEGVNLGDDRRNQIIFSVL